MSAQKSLVLGLGLGSGVFVQKATLTTLIDKCDTKTVVALANTSKTM